MGDMQEITMTIPVVPKLRRDMFEDEDEFLYHQSICQALKRSWEESQKPGAVTYPLDEVMERMRKKYGLRD